MIFRLDMNQQPERDVYGACPNSADPDEPRGVYRTFRMVQPKIMRNSHEMRELRMQPDAGLEFVRVTSVAGTSTHTSEMKGPPMLKCNMEGQCA